MQLHCMVQVVDGGRFNIFPNAEFARSAITWRLLTRNYEGLRVGAGTSQVGGCSVDLGEVAFPKLAEGRENYSFDSPAVRASGEFVANSLRAAAEVYGWPAGTPSSKSAIVPIENSLGPHAHPYYAHWTRSNGFSTSSGGMAGGMEKKPFLLSLNGPWELFVEPTTPGGGNFPGADAMIMPLGEVEVPYAPQSAFSGIQAKISDQERIYYRKGGIQLPGDPANIGEKLQLTVDACDWRCEVFLNGQPVAAHQGGYDSWSVDIPVHLLNSTSSTGASSSSPKPPLEIAIAAWDPTDAGCEFVQTPPVPCIECCAIATQARGKQALNPGFIMYSPVTGLWRNGLWIESVPLCRVTDLSWHYDFLNKKLTLFSWELSDTCGERYLLEGSTSDEQGDNNRVHDQSGALERKKRLGLVARLLTEPRGGKIEEIGAGSTWFSVPPIRDREYPMDSQQARIVLQLDEKNIQEWSPESPTLHELRVELVEEASLSAKEAAQTQKTLEVSSFQRLLGLREFVLQRNQLYLNGKLTMVHGVLHQGYWPETLLTPPSEEAIWQEVRAMKQAGFNTVRVHMIVFPASFYHACDRIGLLVIQDMPSGDGRVIPAWDMHRRSKQTNQDENTGFDEMVRSADSKTQFIFELRQMMVQLKPFCSVVVWVLFNEGWGQSNSLETIAIARALDPTRLIDAVSGWNDPLLFGEPHPAIFFEEDKENQTLTRFTHDIGDFFDVHNYEGAPFQNLSNTFDVYPFPIANRPILVGEYGGIGFSFAEKHEYDADASWGYGNVSKGYEGFVADVSGVFERLRILFCKSGKDGYSYNVIGGVYTQWTDVETEINGLMTYDRKPKIGLDVLGRMSEKLKEGYFRCNAPRWVVPSVLGGEGGGSAAGIISGTGAAHEEL